MQPDGLNYNKVRMDTDNLNHEHLQFKTFDYTEYKPQDIQSDIDPENNFYTKIKNTCEYYTEDQFESQISIKDSLSIIHFNCRSLNANFSKIIHCLKEIKKQFSVIAISETWLLEEQCSQFHIEGYNAFFINRTFQKGGGVALYVDQNLNSCIVKDMCLTIDTIMECVTVEIETEKSKNTIVSCIYRKPGSCIDMFREKLFELYEGLNNRKMIFVCGDINIDLLNPLEQTAITEFINTMYSMCLYPTITKPSRITRNSATLIDNIFTNSIESETTSGLLINDVSDHLPIFMVKKKVTKIHNELRTVKIHRKKNHETLNKFKHELMEQNWDNVYIDDVNTAYNVFLEKFCTLYEKNCPLVTKTICNKFAAKPWMTKGIQKACKKKNKLYKEFLKKRTIEAQVNYKTYKNKLISIMRLSKKEYYSSIIEKNKNNIKNTWNILNKLIKQGKQKDNLPTHILTNDGCSLRQPKEIANEFNNYFSNIGSKLAINIPETHQEDDVIRRIPKQDKTIFLQGTDENEICTIVKQSKNKTSTDWNGVDMCVLKETIDYIIKPVTYICNLSIQTGVFPEGMKRAKVIPIYKSDDQCDLKNYRPISLLSQFAKILEKLFHKRLYNYLENHNILCEQQYGFRPNRTTTLALIDLVENISNAIDNKQYAIGVFLDLTKAFDTINHHLLLRKLYCYGIRGVAFSWIKSYIENRQQYVHINGVDSELQIVTCGVPQGSVLSPLLFIIYINDICLVSKVLHLILFADDTNIIHCGNDLETLVKEVENELELLKSWFDSNKLTLNLKKTKFIVFTNRQTNVSKDLIIHNTAIEQVSQIKFLGVIIQNKLSWKNHIEFIKTKLCKSLAIISKVKECLNKQTLYILYSSLILPYMTYSVEVWGNTYPTYTNKITVIQKRAMRIVNKASYRAHTNDFFIQRNTLKFMDLVDHRTAQFMYKIQNKQLPVQIQDLFKKRNTIYNLRGKNMLKKPRVRTDVKQHCISTAGVNIWNRLDEDIKDCRTLNSFKYMYKKKIIKSYSEIEC
uniref:Reverse transcriptase domain-containing protein n=1 Tax=Oryzias melastigma TaxID=30732 RepID=A0A3B3C2G3_ORYME